MSDEAQWTTAVDRTLEQFGRLNVLVNNAGIALPGSILDSTLEDYHRTVAVNQIGVWHGLRAAAPAMRASGAGSIVNISSAAGLGASVGLATYGMTKWRSGASRRPPPGSSRTPGSASTRFIQG